jgi:tellurite resistance protein TerC|tara:strand:- start:747 stop:2147 length:1401 start_codon:yes stop_codon:yes gene_type:complete
MTATSVCAAHIFFALVYASAMPLVSGGRDAALEFYSCYVIALSLSIDNLLAFYLVFRMFRVPWIAQRRALVWGLIGAIVLRALFILIGSAIVAYFAPFVLLLAFMLVVSGVMICAGASRHFAGQLCTGAVGGGGAAAAGSSSSSVSAVASVPVRFIRRCVPPNTVSEEFDGDHFFVRAQSGARAGRWQATPLLLAVIVLESVDLFFAIDAVPAGLGISTDGVIVWFANFFAVISLRSLFLVVSKLVDALPLLQRAIGGLLVFIGVRMVLSYFDVLHIETSQTFLVVAIVVIGSVGSSIAMRRARAAEDAAAGIGSARRRGEYSVVGLFGGGGAGNEEEDDGSDGGRGGSGGSSRSRLGRLEEGEARGGIGSPGAAFGSPAMSGSPQLPLQLPRLLQQRTPSAAFATATILAVRDSPSSEHSPLQPPAQPPLQPPPPPLPLGSPLSDKIVLGGGGGESDVDTSIVFL